MNCFRYNEIANNVQMQESVSPVHFIIINSMQLKDAIVEHCYLWQDKLAKLLLRLTYNKIRDSYCYNSENTEKYELLHVIKCME
jgi:dynein heavy chain